MPMLLSLSLFVAAQSLVPVGSDATLDALSVNFDRQFHVFNAPFGVELDASVADPAHRQLVRDFIAQDTGRDFAAFTAGQGTPLAVSDVVTSYGEQGDLGMFGGLPAAADAFRYIVLKREAAPPAELDEARADLLAAIAAFHVFGSITGFPGGVARGVNFGGTPNGEAVTPFPGTCPNNWERSGTWRADASGQFPEWVWIDETSIDQVLGYVFALGAFWDAIADDPAIDDSVRTTLQADAAAFGHALMEPVDVGASEPIDLVIRDANGCVTRFHALNPLEVVIEGQHPIVRPADTTQPLAFNALASLGVIRTLFHVSGDDDLRHFYYDELVGARDYPGMLDRGIANLAAMYVDVCVFNNCLATNFSNVNMAWVAAYGVLRYESDPALLQIYRARLEDQLWNPPNHSITGESIEQSFFDLMYSGLRAGGTDEASRTRAFDQLRGWHAAPYFSQPVVNCDDNELAAGSCIAIDDTTVITLDDVPGHGGEVAAIDALPFALRPFDDFEWRSDPRRVNNAGDPASLFAGGDFRVAYWLGRMLVQSADNDLNVSPVARAADGSEGEGEGDEGEGDEGEGDEGEGDGAEGDGAEGDAGEGEGEGSAAGADDDGGAAAGGCACSSSTNGEPFAVALALACVRVVARKRSRVTDVR